MKLIYTFWVLVLVSLTTYGQNVGIGTSSPNALLDVSATNSGILIPRVALTGTGSAGPLTLPTTSTLVYNTATVVSGATSVSPGFYYWNGSAWVRVIDNASLTGATTDTLSMSGNTLTSKVNNVASAQSLSGLSISGDVTGTLAASTVGRIQGTGVAISSLVSNNLLQYNGTNWVNVTPASVLGAATTNALSLSTNTLTSTVNGIAATSSAVSGVSNTSSANTLSTTVNGVTGSTVPIINTNTLGLSGTTLTSTVNGVASTPLDLTSIDNNIYNSDGTLTGNRAVTMGADNLTFSSSSGNLIFNPSSTGKVGIGTGSPAAALDITSTTSGFLPPRLAGNPVTPALGMVYYNTATNCLMMYNGTSWQSVSCCSPGIIVQPVNSAIICSGNGVASFTVGATGAGLTYQWQEFISSWTNITNGGVYSGATTATLYLTNPASGMNGRQYRCIVSGTCSPSATSNAAILTVHTSSIPITFTNNQGFATGANFQQMLVINSSAYAAYESTGLQNVEFSTGPSGTGTILYAWIESGATNTSTSTIYWVNLGSNLLAASGGTLTIYMNFMSSAVMAGQSGYTGVAPNLYGGSYYATSFGQCDNGALVFTQYGGYSWSSFTTVGGTWTTGAGAPLQQTSAAAATNNGPVALIEGTSYPANGSYVLGMAFSYTTNAAVRIGIAAVATPVGSGANAYRFIGDNAAFISFLNDGIAWVVTSGYTGTNNTPYTMVITDKAGTWSGSLYSGYGTETSAPLTSLGATAYTANNASGSSTGYVGISASSTVASNASPMSIQWFYMRACPPAGTMPGVATGSVGCY